MYLLPRFLNPSYLPQFWSPAAIEMASFKHAISTPVTVLLSTVPYSKHKLSDDSTAKQVKHALHTLQQLCGSFNSNTLSCCRLGSLLEEIAEMLSDGSQEVKVESLGGKKEVVLTSVQVCRLKEALTCLIKNGLESYQDSVNRKVIVLYTQNRKHVLVHIKDFGCGMNMLQQLLIAVPFISFKTSGKGIGCAFSRRVIELELKGRVIVHSCVGMGTSIECKIPISR